MLSRSEEDTRACARALARELKRGSIVTLEGEVGAGKTVFARALIQALVGAEIEVNSPTFTLVQTYPITLANGDALTLWHCDLYRLKDPSELMELALEEALEDGIVLMEWPEIARDYLPNDVVAVRIAVRGESEREIVVSR